MSRNLRRFVPAALVAVLVVAALGPLDPGPRGTTGPAPVDPKTITTVSDVAGLPRACQEQSDGRIVCNYDTGDRVDELAVPAGATQLRYTVSGAQGSSGDPNTNATYSAGGAGAGGAQLQGYPGGIAGKTVIVAVGSAGSGPNGGGQNPNRVAGNFSGGNGGNGTTYGGKGGHGGAGSALLLKAVENGGMPLVVAGGGGGGGGGHRDRNDANAGQAGGLGANHNNNGQHITIGGNGGDGYGSGGSGSGGGGGGGGYVRGGFGGSGGNDGRGGGGEGGGNWNGNGATVDKDTGTKNGVHGGAGHVDVAWYRSTPTTSTSVPTGTVYAYQTDEVTVSLHLPATAGGTVDVYDNNTLVCDDAVVSNATASCALSGNELFGGSHQIRFDYSGDGGYNPVYGTNTSFDVRQNPVTSTVAASKQDDGTYTLSATVTPASGVPDGVVHGSLSLGLYNAVGGATAASCATVTSPAADVSRGGDPVTNTCNVTVGPGFYKVRSTFIGTADTATPDPQASADVTVAKLTPTVDLDLGEVADGRFGGTSLATVTVRADDATSDPSGTVTVRLSDATTGPMCTDDEPDRVVNHEATYTCGITPNAGTSGFRATYAGNSAYESGSSGVETLSVDAATPTVTLTAPSTTVTAKDSVTFTVGAEVGTADVTAGTLTVYEGDQPVGSVDLAAHPGGGTVTTGALTAGEHDYVVSYSAPEGGNYASDDDAAQLTITAAPLAAGLDVGVAVDRDHIVSAGVPVTVTGTLTVSDRDDAPGRFTIDPDGSCETRDTSASGTRTVVYTCSYYLAAGASPSFTVTYADVYTGEVSATSPTVTLPASPVTVSASATERPTYGTTPDLTAGVNPLVAGTPTDGNVEFFVDDVSACTANVVVGEARGAATCRPSALPHAGTHTVRATYTPSTANAGRLVSGNSSDHVLTVVPAPASIALTASPEIDGASEKLVVAVTATADTGTQTPTGTVDFGAALDACGTVSLAAGTASCTIDLPAPGTKVSLRAGFTASGDFTGGTTTSVVSTYQREPKGVCANGFDELWAAAQKGTFDLDADPLGTVSFTPRGNLGRCDASALLGGTADVSLFGGTLTASAAKVTVTSKDFCLTGGSFALPGAWRTEALAVTASVCFPVTDAGSNGGIGRPTQGTLARADSGKNGAPLLAVPGVTRAAAVTARFCPEGVSEDGACAKPKSLVTVTGVVPATTTAPGVTVAATLRADGGLRATVATTTVALLGTAVTFDGTITRDGTGPLDVDVDATTDTASVPTTGLIVDAGTEVRLAGATGNSPAYAVDGTAHVGAPGARLPLTIGGTIGSPSSYELTLAGSGATWTPVTGLELKPDATGTLTVSPTATSFTLGATGAPLATWRPIAGATVAVTSLRLGQNPAASCPFTGAGTVLELGGSFTAGGLAVAADGCVALTDGGWHVGSASKTATLGRLALTGLGLDATKRGGSTATFTGAATATLKAGKTTTAAVTLQLANGTLVAAGPFDASDLGLPTKTGYLAYAATAVDDWRTGIKNVGANGTLDLPAGLTVFGAVALPSAVVTVLREAKFTLAANAVATFTATVPDVGDSLMFRTALGAPSGIPLLTLPAGATVTSAAVGYGNGRFSLVADGAVAGQDGKRAPVHLNVSIADDGSLTGSASVDNLGLFGRSVDLAGAVSRSAGGTFRATVSGSISGSIPVGDATLRNVRVAVGSDGLAATGTLAAESLAVPFTVSFASTTSYALRVDTRVTDWTPARGVTVDAEVTGALSKSARGYGYDLVATPTGDRPLVAVTPTTGVTMSLSSLRLSNTAATPSGCALADPDDAWLGVSGSVTLTTGPSKGTGAGAGCFDLTHPSFALTALLPGKDFGNDDAGVELGNLTVKVGRDSTGGFEVSARTRLSVQMITGGQFSAIVPLVFGDKGFAVGGEADLTNFLGGSAARAYLFLSYTKLTVDTGSDAVGKLKLSPGVTVGIAFSVGGSLAKALDAVGSPVGAGSKLAATVQLDPKAKSVKLRVDLDFDATNIFTLDNGTYLRLDDMSLVMTIAPSASPTFAFETNATLHLPASVPGGAVSDVALRGGIKIGTELTAYFSVSEWHDALGLRGLELKSFVLQGGITLTGLPLPSLAVSASVDGLPDSLARAIGYQQGAPVSLTLAVSQVNLLVDVKIGTKGSRTPALVPFEAFGRADLLSVNYAELYLSPTGATVGDQVYPAGFSLAFQGRIVGVDVDVLLKVDPVRQTTYFRGTVGTISIGSLVMGPTTLTIDVSKKKFDMAFTGRIKIGPSTTQIGPALRFSGYLDADISLQVGTSGISALLNFQASVASSNYLPQDTCKEDGIWLPCNYRWVDTSPLTITATNLGFDLNSSGLTVKIPNTANSITFPWPKSPTSAGARSLTGRGGAVQVLAARQTNVPSARTAPATVPAQGTWQRTGSLGSRRMAAGSVALRDGRVLAIGGTSGGDRALDTVESYDVGTGGWREAAAMRVARINPSAVQLRDGRVLVVGGDTGRGETAAAELYDPASNRWSDAGAMSIGRQSPAITVLADGSVLVAGGHVQGSPQIAVDHFDPKDGTWRRAAPLPAARSAAAAALLTDGTVLVAGGMGRRGPLASALRYDPAADAWQSAATMAQPRFYAAATTLDDGSVLVAGGAAEAERYVPSTNSWRAAGMLGGPTQLAATVKLPDGDVLVAGGLAAGKEVVQVDRYDPATGRWTAQGALPGARAVTAAAVLPSGDALVAGGLDDHEARADAVVYRTKAGGRAVPSAEFEQAATQSSGVGTGTWLGVGGGVVLLLAAAALALLVLRRPRSRHRAG